MYAELTGIKIVRSDDKKLHDNKLLFKERYADKIKDLIPEGLKLYKMVEFLPKEKQLGNLFHQSVILGQEHGVTI